MLRHRLERIRPGRHCLLVTHIRAVRRRRQVLRILAGRIGVDEGMLVYLVGKQASFVQLITRNKIVVAPVPVGSAALETVVARLRRGLEIEGSSVSDFDLDAAHALYKDLFTGMKDEIADLKRIVIVPAGPLANLPFGVLVTKPPVRGQYVSAH